MSLIPLLLATASMANPPSLYGPLILHFRLDTVGNPFDPAQNDVRAVFHLGKVVAERLAYFAHDQWHVRGYLPQPGTYTVDITLNGHTQAKLLDIVVPKRAETGMVRTNGKWFTLSDGKPYWPVGIDTAWGGDPTHPVTSYFPKMKAAGMNWARVWACHWDQRNPYWTTRGEQPKDGWMSEDALDRWDDVVSAAQKAGIKFQFVCFHHGQWSSSVNPNWPENPWNAKNGGFLKSAADFFTDPEAKRRTKMLLRYFVARYGYSPSIMAWELFNEVQFTDRIREKNDWETVGRWHDEMAEYIRSIDSNHHLITTSSELGQPIWRRMDYQQGHGYPASVAGMLAGTPNHGPKPMFFGEIGPSGAGSDRAANQAARREGVWAAFFAGHSGAGEYWSWDQMDDDAYRAYAFSNRILKSLPPVSSFVRVPIMTHVAAGGDLTIRPGRGWDKSDLTSFHLPEDATAAKTGQMSSYLQGVGHRDMQPKPVEFSFVAPRNGTLSLHIAEVSGGGGKLEVSVNGSKVAERDCKGGQHPADPVLSVPFPKGKVRISIENTGPDWINVDRFTLTGIAPLATVEAASTGKVAVIHALTDHPGTSVTLENLGLGGTAKRLTIYDLDSRTSKVLKGKISIRTVGLVLEGKDQIVVVQ